MYAVILSVIYTEIINLPCTFETIDKTETVRVSQVGVGHESIVEAKLAVEDSEAERQILVIQAAAITHPAEKKFLITVFTAH